MRRALGDWPGGLPVGGYNVNNLRYADDTILISTSVADMVELLKRVKLENELLVYALMSVRQRSWPQVQRVWKSLS